MQQPPRLLLKGSVTLRSILALCTVMLLVPSSSWARQTIADATGSIVGTVYDGTGAVLPNVAVTISSVALMAPRTTLTNAEGRYRFASLPPGEYRLAFALDGFRTLEEPAIRVGLGFTATVDVALTVATLPEQVTVTGRSRLLDRHSTALAETFNASRLANLPSSRSIFALLANTPAVEVAHIEVGGGAGGTVRPYGAYGTRGFNRPMLEGISVTGIFPTGFPLDFGSFEEVSVLTGAHGPEWPTPGVHMQLITKSGGNQYRGTLYADYENRRWQSYNVDEGQIARGARGGNGLSARDANRLWQYHDVNTDIGGFIVRNRLWWYGSIREQKVASRLLNFPVKPHRTDLNNFTGKSTFRITPNNKVVAFAQAGRNRQPNRLDPFGPKGGNLTATTAIQLSEDSTANQRNAGWVWKGEWTSVVDARFLFELRAGQFGADQAWAPYSALPRFEDRGSDQAKGGNQVSGGNRDWQRGLRRNQAFGTVSHFSDGGMTSHHLKVGTELSRALETETWRAAYPGGVLHVLLNGNPVEVYLFQAPSHSESGFWSYAAYASDSVRLKDRLTLNLGLRFDRYRVFLPAQAHPAGSPTAQRFAAVNNVIARNLVVPRLGAVYDLTGQGRTLAKVSAGRYRLPPGTTLGFNANPNSNVWWKQFSWTDADGSGVWEPGEEGPKFLEQRGGAAIESLDPGLQFPVVNELAAWLEHELASSILLRTGAVWRADHQNYMRQNASQPFDAFTVPVTVRDPGPDGRLDTADDGPAVRGYDLRAEFVRPPVNIVRNVPGAGSENLTAEIAATRRSQDKWSAGAGFAHTWNRDQSSGYAGQSVRNNTYPLTPNDLINAAPGGRHKFTTWTAKLHATAEAPWGLRITPALRHQSGQPFGRTFAATAFSYGVVRVLAEPVGTRRMDNITIADVRIEKRILLRRTRRTAVFLDVFNMLNANPEQNVDWSSGQSFLRPVTIVPPRIARIGMKLDW